MNIKSFLEQVFTDEDLQNYKPNHPRFWHYLKVYIICCAITTFLTIGYVEIGHDKGWNRADTWYTCLHTHHHFPWQ